MTPFSAWAPKSLLNCYNLVVACLPAGHVSQLLGPKSPWNIANWVNMHGPVVKVQLLDDFGVVLTDPDSIACITRKTGA
jgi:hypothetical protein